MSIEMAMNAQMTIRLQWDMQVVVIGCCSNFLALQTINQVSGGSFCKIVLRTSVMIQRALTIKVELTLLRSS